MGLLQLVAEVAVTTIMMSYRPLTTLFPCPNNLNINGHSTLTAHKYIDQLLPCTEQSWYVLYLAAVQTRDAILVFRKLEILSRIQHTWLHRYLITNGGGCVIITTIPGLVAALLPVCQVLIELCHSSNCRNPHPHWPNSRMVGLETAQILVWWA